MNNKFNQRFPNTVKQITPVPSAADLDAVAAEQKAKEATAGNNSATVTAAPSKEQLEKLAADFKNSFGGNARKGIKTLPDGSIELSITIDVDMAGSLLAWAEGAGEDAATFIQSTISEALLMHTGK